MDLWLRDVCDTCRSRQVVQEKCSGESGGAVRLQRLRLSDGDDRQSQTAQLYHRRGELKASRLYFLFCLF